MHPGGQSNNPQSFLPNNLPSNGPMAGANIHPVLPFNPMANPNITPPIVPVQQKNLSIPQNYPMPSKAPVGLPQTNFGPPHQHTGFPPPPTTFNQPNLPGNNFLTGTSHFPQTNNGLNLPPTGLPPPPKGLPPPPTGLPPSQQNYGFSGPSTGAPQFPNSTNLAISGAPQPYLPGHPGPSLGTPAAFQPSIGAPVLPTSSNGIGMPSSTNKQNVNIGFPNSIPQLPQFPPPNIPPPSYSQGLPNYNQGPPIYNSPAPYNPGPSYQPNPNLYTSISSSSASISISLSQESKTVYCSAKIAGIFNSHNLHREIARKYNGDIAYQGNKFLVSGQNKSIVDQMSDELESLIKQYTFDENATWAYLENDGSYRLYDPNTKSLIEDRYQTYYPELTSANYANYSLNIEFTLAGASYILEFAKIGGVHRQKRKNVGEDTIRAVKRQGNGEDLNKNFVRNYVWKWKHESGDFKDYEPDAIFLIEQSFIEYKTGKTKTAIVLIQGCNGKTYKLDFQQQIQFNEITNFKRPIIRDPPIS